MLQVHHYLTNDSRNPFDEWASTLDKVTRARVAQRLDRMAHGNLGDYKHVKERVYEARLDFGPGYRLYFAREGLEIIVLLCGGDKGTQDRDIDRAVEFLRDYLTRRTQ